MRSAVMISKRFDAYLKAIIEHSKQGLMCFRRCRHFEWNLASYFCSVQRTKVLERMCTPRPVDISREDLQCFG